ncbi:MAG TPA: energy transducer TonB [Verrucomicrobiae bacterium]|jgi:TonB family protein|nr:energy transducer TonB [Verrucomicrobiae bacterium]
MDNNKHSPQGRPPTDQSTAVKFSKEQAAVPSILSGAYGTQESHPENFLLSFLTHVVLLLLLFGAIRLASAVAPKVAATPRDFITLSAADLYHVGKHGNNAGGGGDSSKLQASKGTPPKAAMHQYTPPQVLPPRESKLQVEPTVIADLKIPQSNQVGDPLSKLLAASNGSGVGGGLGNGSGGGVGPGRGPGVGPGVFRCCGSGVNAPKPLYTPEPEFSEEARKAKYQGVVVLEVIVGTDGRVHNPRVVRSLGMGLDEKAREGVLTWKFDPATKDGRPVAVQMNVEVAFNLY